MGISIDAGPDFKLDLTDLKDLKNELLTKFKLLTQMPSDFQKPLSAVPDTTKVDIHYDSGNKIWDLDTVGFTLSGKFGGSIKVYKSGKLYDYTDDFPTVVQLGLDTQDNSDSSTTSYAVDAGAIYVGLELDFAISAGFTFATAATSFGLSASGSASTSDSFTVAFYKKCDPSEIFFEAIGKTFQNLVLPFHANTVKNLGIGDVLRHTAAANLQLGLGAGIGISNLSVASQWAGGIPRLPKSPELNVGIMPTATPAVTVAYSFGYAGTFEQCLIRDAENSARLHLYRSSDTTHALSFDAGVTFNVNASAEIDVQKQILEAPKNATSNSTLQSALDAAFNAASGEIGSLAGDINKKIVKILDPVNQDLNVGINATISTEKQSFLLTDYTIDLTNDEYAKAWDDMIHGRFVDALNDGNGRVQLAVGSGLEKLYNKTASFSLNFFGDAAVQLSTATIKNLRIVYAGNNMFHVFADGGKQHLSNIEGTFKEIDFYFSLEMSLAASGAAAGAQPDLNIIMKATSNPEFGKRIGKTYAYLTSGLQDAAPLVIQKQIEDSLMIANSTQVLHVIIPQSAYSKVSYSPAGSRPPDDQADRTNYAALRAASGLTMEVDPARFVFNNVALDYDLWAAWDAAAIGDTHADRQKSTNYPAAYPMLGSTFRDIDDPSRFKLSVTFEAARNFMNLCEELNHLCGAQVSLPTVESFADHLTSIAGKDVDLDYIQPTALALFQLCGGKPSLVVGPAPGLSAGSSVGITVSLAGNGQSASSPAQQETAAALS